MNETPNKITGPNALGRPRRSVGSLGRIGLCFAFFAFFAVS